MIWVNDDVSEETRAHRKTVRDVAALAKHLGNNNIKVHGDGLVIGPNKYRHDKLDLLPPNLSVSKAKLRDEDTGIYFQGENSPYSNFYNSRFQDKQGQTYENVEQAFQHKKALAHGNLTCHLTCHQESHVSSRNYQRKYKQLRLGGTRRKASCQNW